MKLRFLGAAGTVTGSRTLLTSGASRVLVDCGMFQGYKALRLRNWGELEVDPRAIDAVVLTHAHLDHSGWLPALVKRGFQGRIHCTEGTAGLLEIMLPDAGRIQEEDAEHANRRRWSKHKPALPMYTEADALKTLTRVVPHAWEDTVEVGALRATFHPAGHILGAACVRVADATTSVLFSGDLGRPGDILMQPPVAPPAADHLVVESTYGDRSHADEDPLTDLAEVVTRTVGRGGVVMIPSFAVGRAQTLLLALHLLQREGRIPRVPVFLDSPMAVDTTELYLRHRGEMKFDPESVGAMHQDVGLLRSVTESRSLNHRTDPFVLVASSGMLTGGRMLHHLALRAGSPKNTLLFVGYQAPGTRGAKLLQGEEEMRFHGRTIAVRCEVARIDGFSAHADREELVAWMRRMPAPPRRIFLNHGEAGPADTFRGAIRDALGWEAEVATEGVEWDLEGTAGIPAAPSSPPPSPSARGPRAGGAVSLPRTHACTDDDATFLARDDMRAVRLMIEYERVERALVEDGIHATIAVFGSARVGGDGDDGTDPALGRCYEEARRFGRLVAEAGQLGGERVAVVTGGGPGLMEAANRGALEGGGPSLGFHITLPREQASNAYLSPEHSFRFHYFALRKMHFMRRARALVAFPGGYGTLDELFDALCLVQTGKVPRIPVVLVGSEFWGRVFPGPSLAAAGLIGPADAELVTVVDSAAEAWAAIEGFSGS